MPKYAKQKDITTLNKQIEKPSCEKWIIEQVSGWEYLLDPRWAHCPGRWMPLIDIANELTNGYAKINKN